MTSPFVDTPASNPSDTDIDVMTRNLVLALAIITITIGGVNMYYNYQNHKILTGGLNNG